jgi:hypothetical protein
MVHRKLKTLSIISIVLGVLGLCVAFAGAANLFAVPGKTTGTGPAQTAAFIEVQQEMDKAVTAVTDDWLTYSRFVVTLTFIVSAALVVGGIMSLKLREQGRDILMTTFVVAILLKVLHGVSSVAVGLASWQILREFRPKAARASLPAGVSPPEGIDDLVINPWDEGYLFGLALAMGWLLLQIGFFIVGSIYLRNPEVRAAFRARVRPMKRTHR